MSRVISFSSGKGGVGKTTVVASLGTLWAKRGKRVLLVDGDWSLGKLGITLGARPQWTVEKVLAGEVSLQEAVYPVAENLSLLAAPSGAIGFEEMTEAMRAQLFWELDVLSGKYDFVLLDHSSGLHWNVLQFAAAAHQHVVITTAEPTSYSDAYAIMKILSKRFGIREFWLLVTMSQKQAETEAIIGRFSDLACSHLDIRLHLLDIFPWEPRVAESIRCQKAFVDRFPQLDLTTKLQRVCRVLDVAKPELSHGLSFFYPDNISQRDAR